MLVDEAVRRTLLTNRGPEAEVWLGLLPGLLECAVARWQLHDLAPFPDLSFNWAGHAHLADGTPVVLKVCPPDREFHSEAAALRLFHGRGSVQLLGVEPEDGALLLERLLPGKMLTTLPDDDEATRIACRVMRDLWVPAPTDPELAALFPTVERWFQGFVRLRQTFHGGTGPFPATLVEEAERLAAALLAENDRSTLLHGDLHHFNILTSQRGWVAIDPKGVVGDPAYETAALLHNPWDRIMTRPDPAGLFSRRITIMAEELGIDGRRILAWGLSHAVLSAWWCYESCSDWRGAIAQGEVLFHLQ
jgi:streptomycin 6-kinase